MTKTAAPADKPQRRTHETRCDHVIKAAIRLFAEKGFQGTKTREIAEAAGVNEALIFRDFQSKENLYAAILDYGSCRVNPERLIAELSPYAAARDDEQLFRGLALKIMENYGRERELFRLMMYSGLEQHELACRFRERQGAVLERFLEEYVKSRQRDGAFTDVDPHAAARGFLGMCNQHVLLKLLFGRKANAPADHEAAAAFTSICLGGLHAASKRQTCEGSKEDDGKYHR